MHISLIAAMSKNRVIGNSNALPWHLPADLKHFKKITIGKTILMGRKTYESIGKPLPGRKNIILTREKNFQAPDCLVIHNINELPKEIIDHEIMVIGGAEIFQLFLAKAQRFYLTLIDAEIAGDIYFPEWNEDDWVEISREEHHADENNPYNYSFVEYINPLHNTYHR